MKLVGSNNAVRSSEFHKRKLWEGRLKALAIILLVLVLIVGPIIILRSKRFLISDVQISGNQVTKSQDLEKIVADDLSGNYLWFLPKSSAALYPKSKIERDIASSTPRLSSVTVSLAGAHSLKVVVTERQPHALYCTDNCYFIDESGYIFSAAPDFSGDVYMVYTTDPALANPLRTQLFAPDEFKKLEAFLKNLATLNMTPMSLKKVGDEFDLTLSSGPLVKWMANEDLDAIFVNLQSFIENSSLKPADIARMTYIDLSFDNKVFYKFQGE